MKLLIVESPNKTKTIKKYLGDGWQVEASFGHIRDLPVKTLGVDLNSFQPEYEPTERGGARIKSLQTAAKNADEIYLATDPDREGEAIAWHLAEVLGKKHYQRVTFAEITEKAVNAAVAQPRQIDLNLVKAQEARRVLDRLVGYPVSQAVQRVLNPHSSAGRVQSPAVKIVVEREKAITQFKATTHYGVEFIFEALDNIATGWKAVWNTKNFLQGDSEYFLDKALAEQIAGLKYFNVTKFEDSESKKAPAAPFTTSTLQQAASKKLKFSPKKTMDLAQQLFADGHITYMRTDSPNLSAEAIETILEYCRANDLPATASGRKFKVKGDAQEAHEAIRPTQIDVESAGADKEQQALYKLIRLQAIASQMADAVYAVRKVELQSEEQLEGKNVILDATGKTLTFAGWTVLFNDTGAGADDEEPAEAENPIPELRPESRMLSQSAEVKTKQTKPPTRFTEATLIRQLENAGIGRPATYAAILTNIMSKGYLQVDDKRFLHPSNDGMALVEMLDKNFKFMNLEFTRDIENDLDAIAGGKKTYKDLVANIYAGLKQELASFAEKHPAQESESIPCPKCQKPLRRLKNKTSGKFFWACSEEREKCGFTAPDDNGKLGQRKEVTMSEFMCPACNKPLILRSAISKKTKKPYEFFGCSGYPDCKKMFFVKDGKPDFESGK
ncbi:type I DNA topoisomerase [Desulfovibrio sp. OttesenSCG-928-F07]|nr:type I DNA topoisomerase [Desulfovibrio sp. OttesenSCG-928-F07]